MTRNAGPLSLPALLVKVLPMQPPRLPRKGHLVPKAFSPAEPVEVAGLFKGGVPRRTDAQIAAALHAAARKAWRGRD